MTKKVGRYKKYIEEYTEYSALSDEVKTIINELPARALIYANDKLHRYIEREVQRKIEEKK